MLTQQGTLLNCMKELFIFTPNVKNLYLEMPFSVTNGDFSKQCLPFTYTFFSTARTHICAGSLAL